MIHMFVDDQAQSFLEIRNGGQELKFGFELLPPYFSAELSRPPFYFQGLGPDFLLIHMLTNIFSRAYFVRVIEFYTIS